MSNEKHLSVCLYDGVASEFAETTDKLCIWVCVCL